MEKKIEIGELSKVEIEWQVRPIDYSEDKVNEIRSKMAEKYGIPKKNICVTANFIKTNADGVTEIATADVFQNIQEPKFQQELFKKYLIDNNITDYDFDAILKIDNVINSTMDYSSYARLRRYKVEWVRWSNFLSYGEDNFINFNDLKGLVLLKSEPANQGGKTNFACDLIEFLLFGSIDSGKASVLKKVFNHHLPESTEVKVEGGIEIDGEHYVIKRTLTRPQLKKRTAKSTVTNKVEYFKVVDGTEQVLEDVENLEAENNTQTNKVIKEAIGNKKDFNLVVLANSDNLKELVSMKDTERGKLLSRWIGLLPLEEKDIKAREKWNKEILPTLTSSKYNKEDLTNTVNSVAQEITNLETILVSTEEQIKNSENKIKELQQEKDNKFKQTLALAEGLDKLDVVTIELKQKNIIEEGKVLTTQIESITKEIESLGTIEYSDNEYRDIVAKRDELVDYIANIKANIKILQEKNKTLAKGEYCPTCGQKLPIDNSEPIAKNNAEIEVLIKNGVAYNTSLEEIKKQLTQLEIIRQNFNKKNTLEVKKASLTVNLTSKRTEYLENNQLLKDINRNKEAIVHNNNITTQVNVIQANIDAEEKIRIRLISEAEGYKKEIKLLNAKKTEYQIIINKLSEEEILIKAWKYYLLMVGKNGIGKMVLRQTLPIINAELSYLLEDVCDFKISVEIDDKNDINFYIITDNVKSDLSSGSGFEQTVAALALRAVLGNISTMSRPSFILLDEVLGGVAKDNYDNIKKLYDRILKDYSFIFQVTHLDDIADWHDTTVVVKKENRVSKIMVQK